MTLLYCIQVMLFWSLGLLVYRLGFCKLKLFTLSRFFLLILFPLGMVAPLFSTFWVVTSESNLVVWMDELVVGSSGLAFDSASGTGDSAGVWASWIWLGIVVYFTGFMYVVLRTAKAFGNLRSLRRNSQYIDRVEGVKIYAGSFPYSFSFIKEIYLPKSVVEDSESYRTIVLHELVHVKERHWVDKVWMLLCCSVFWFIPWIYWIRNALEEVHEYRADFGVLKQVDRRFYFQLLLGQQLGVNSPSPVFVSPFFSNNLKNRISMMTSKIKNRTFHYIVILISVLLMWAFSSVDHESKDLYQATDDSAMIDSIPQTDPPASFSPVDVNNSESDYPEPIETPEGELIFQMVDQMPRFPGCEEMVGSLEEKKMCADMKMLEYIYQNIKYPEEARVEEISGQVVASFIVKSSGQMDEITIRRDIGGGCGEEVARVLEKMSSKKIWIPGKHQGQAVHVQYNIPIRFTLD